MSGSGISWAICKPTPRSREITTPAPHHLSVFRGRMPFLSPNSQCQSTEGIRKCRKIGRLLERVITQSMSSTSIQQSKIQNVRRKRTKPKKVFFQHNIHKIIIANDEKKYTYTNKFFSFLKVLYCVNLLHSAECPTDNTCPTFRKRSNESKHFVLRGRLLVL